MDNLITRGHWGTFTLSRQFRIEMDDETIQALFKDFIPSHVEPDWKRNQLRYFGWHPSWEKVPEGSNALEYVAHIFTVGIVIHVDWKRCDSTV